MVVKQLILMAGLWAMNACTMTRLSIKVPSAETRCFTDIFGQSGIKKAAYQVHFNDTDEEEGFAAMYQVTITRDLDKARVFSSVKNLGSFSINNTQGSNILTFCAENYIESEILITWEISAGVDLNDFNQLPFSNPNQTINATMQALEGMINSMIPMREYSERQVKSMNQSVHLFNFILGIAGYAIGLTFILGCAQTMFLKQKLINKKVE